MDVGHITCPESKNKHLKKNQNSKNSNVNVNNSYLVKLVL